jgi:hypothetical protein
MKKITIYTVIVCISLLWIGCQDDPEPGGTYYVDDGSGNLVDILGGYYKAMTFNTASNTTDSIWVSDLGHFWTFQVKVAYDKESKTFSATEGQNVSYDSKVTITDGKVLIGEGTSTSGVQTDSIYFVASFDDDVTPYANNFIVAGHRRTGFLEDEHE